MSLSSPSELEPVCFIVPTIMTNDAPVSGSVTCETTEPKESKRKTDAMEVTTGAMSEGPPRKRIRFVPLNSEWHDVYDAFRCAQSAMSCANFAIEELERKKYAEETAIRGEKRMLECALVEERRLHTSFQIALQEQVQKVISLEAEREAAQRLAQDALSQLKHAEDAHGKTNQESQAIIASMQADQRELTAQREEVERSLELQRQSYVGEIASLQCRLQCEQDVGQIALTDKENARKKLVLVQEERNSALRALAQQRAHMAKRETDLTMAVKERENVEKEMGDFKCECALVEERRLHTSFQIALQEQVQKVISLEAEREAAQMLAQDALSQLKHAEDAHGKNNQESQAIIASMQADQRELTSQREEVERSLELQRQSYVGEIASLQCRLQCEQDVGQIALTDKENVRKKFVFVQRERDTALLALAQQRAHMAKRETDLTMAVKEREKLEDEANLMREEAAAIKRKNMTDMNDLEIKLNCLTEEKDRLDQVHEKVQRNLEDEAERSLCQICLEVPKDTISFPCLHLHYCFSCLEKHRKRINTCPSCWTSVSGVLKTDIC